MVILEFNHTRDHVLGELGLYAPLDFVGSYFVVFDIVIEDLDGVELVDRPWGKGDNPKTAVAEFLKTNSGFGIERAIDEELLASDPPDGYLKRVS
jgi:cephalosporin hydroxylase